MRKVFLIFCSVFIIVGCASQGPTNSQSSKPTTSPSQQKVEKSMDSAQVKTDSSKKTPDAKSTSEQVHKDVLKKMRAEESKKGLEERTRIK